MRCILDGVGRDAGRRRVAESSNGGRAPVLEIEAKFRVPDDRTFQRLLEVATLGGFALGPASMVELHDRYLDTARGALFHAGYACRLRHDGRHVIATVKGLGGAEGAVHRRVEYELDLPALLPPVDWPAGRARDLVLQLCADEPLTVLFDLEQIRHARRVLDGERAVAELNVSQVKLRLETYLELEVELLPDGTEQDLEPISRELGTDWRLEPEEESKFQRALARLWPGGPLPTQMATEAAPHLTAQERATMERLAQERAVLARRARLVLAWDDGASVATMLARSGLSPRRARYWRWAFHERRLGIFPRRALASASGTETPPRADRPGTTTSVQGHTLAAAAAPPSEGMPATSLPRRPGVQPGDAMSEAGRKVLRFHLRRMLLNEPGTRRGNEIEALHDMRVATRRMRAAFRIFEEYFEAGALAPFLKTLRRTGRALGEVRDLDVFRDKVRAYLETVPEAQTGGLDGFLVELQARREAARMRLLAHLDGAEYLSFVSGFSEFVETPGMGSQPCGLRNGVPVPCRVRQVAPVVVVRRLAAVRAYEEWVAAPDVPLQRLHALRIAAKQLRYALEFFSEVLGPESKDAIKRTVALQDHLGLLQDGVIATGILRDFLAWGTWGCGLGGKKPRRQARPVIAPGVAIYLAARQSEMQQLLAGFPAVWGSIPKPEFVRGVLGAVAIL